MTTDHVNNARKTVEYLLSARRRMAKNMADNYDRNLPSHLDHATGEKYHSLQRGIEAAKAALDDELARAGSPQS